MRFERELLPWKPASCVTILIPDPQNFQVCVPSKALPAVGAFIAERDVGVRNAALDMLVAAFQTYGEQTLHPGRQAFDRGTPTSRARLCLCLRLCLHPEPFRPENASQAIECGRA